MDFRRFVEVLPGLYEDWGQPTVRPRSDRFGRLLARVHGMPHGKGKSCKR